MELVTKVLSTVANFFIFVSVALGLSGEEAAVVLVIAGLYSLTGLILSEAIPKFLESRGVTATEEKEWLSKILLSQWIVGIFFVAPRLIKALEVRS